MARYHQLAHGEKPTSSGFPYPYDVDLCLEGVASPVAFSEGVGHGAAGGLFTASEALEPRWREHLETARGLWLLPYIERLARGIAVEEAEVLREYRRIHGKEPGFYEIRV